MKISVNDIELFTLSDTQKKIISNDINEDHLDQDLKRRLEYILMHKCQKCTKRLFDEWLPIIKTRYKTLPSNDEELAELIFTQPDYKSKKIKDIEEEEKNKKLAGLL